MLSNYYWVYSNVYTTHPVFSLSDLEDLEFLPASAQGDLSVDFVVNPLRVCQGSSVFPVGSEGGDEFPPIDVSVSVIELVGHGVHLQLGGRELVLEDAVDEVVADEESVGVFVQLPEQVRHPRLFVVVVLEESLPPLVPVEVLDLLQLLQVAQLVLEATVALPSHHPDVTPLVPEGLGPRVLDALVLTADALSAARATKRGKPIFSTTY